MKNSKIILPVFLILSATTVFSLIKYLPFLREKHLLQLSIKQTKEQLAALETEKQDLILLLENEKQASGRLSQENSGLKENLKLSQEKLDKINAALEEAQKSVRELSAQAHALEKEKLALAGENNSLNSQITELSRQNQEFKARLQSVSELKKAIRELKRDMFQAKIDLLKQADQEKLAQGNHGFVIREGKPTYSAKVRIEVIPVSPK